MEGALLNPQTVPCVSLGRTQAVTAVLCLAVRGPQR